MKSMKNKIISFLQEETLSKYRWLLPDGDLNAFMNKRLRKTMIYSIILLFINLMFFFISYFLDISISYIPEILLSIVIIIILYKKEYWAIKMTFKRRRDDVYKSFPLWVSTLEILVMSNNIPNTFKKSIDTCPISFRDDLIDFVSKIEFDPENKEYYRNFLKRYNIDEVNEIIMDMYSFNKLNKNEIVHEFKNLNERLNKISNNIRVKRQENDLFFISALNSLPIMTVSIYVLFISMTMSSM